MADVILEHNPAVSDKQTKKKNTDHKLGIRQVYENPKSHILAPLIISN